MGNSLTASYTNTGLDNGTTYYYVVSAVNTGGESADSSETFRRHLTRRTNRLDSHSGTRAVDIELVRISGCHKL